MKTRLLHLLTVLALAVSASAAEIKPPTFVPASGLQLSLNTGGYKFFAGDATTLPAVTNVRVAKLGGLLPTRDGFAASAILANTSRSAIPFEFNDAGAAAVKFKFSVSDAGGALVWQSDTGLVSAQVVTAATLGRGERWKRTIQIPLKVGGAWLKPGLYTLEATLPAMPSVSAATIFEVANLPEVPPSDTGIIGHVVEQPLASGSLTIVDPVPVKAHISILEKRLPNARYDHPAFSWNGETDDGGNFKAATPPGTFLVTAFRILNSGGLVPLNAVVTPEPTGTPTIIVGGPIVLNPGQLTSAEVSVDAGKYSEVTLTFHSTPPLSSGIHGLVLIGPISPVQHIGEPNERPLAGALVTVDSIDLTASASPLPHPGFHWEGKTNSEGRFEVATPPGLYHVTARQPDANAHIGAPGSADVAVTEGHFSEVTLHVDSGIR